MKSEIKLQKNHTLSYWRVDDVDVIVPEHEVDGEKRGGIPLCAPMFSVQQRPVDGCDLPLHGLLMYSDHGDVTHDEKSRTWTAITRFPASKIFNWDFTVTTRVTAQENTLKYHMEIKRSAECTNENEMPLSFGFHPFFNTFGEDFSYIINDNEKSKSEIPENIIDSDFAPYDTKKAAVLRTAAGILTMRSTGFDEYCLWTDNIDSYFCIEPIYQYREFGFKNTGLSTGALKDITVNLTFTPASD